MRWIGVKICADRIGIDGSSAIAILVFWPGFTTTPGQFRLRLANYLMQISAGPEHAMEVVPEPLHTID